MAEEEVEGYVMSSWEWPDEPPSTDEVLERLKELPDWYGGIRPEQYVAFVQPLPQNKNVSTTKEKNYKTVWTLYITVAGRIAMVNAAANDLLWQVDFVPEPVTPTGIPGYLQYDERIVYREYMEVHVIHEGVPVFLGRKPGTAWVPGAGGSGAVSSNRFEKVETSARGRAIGAWGIGILPGSGVASYEEMRDREQLEAAVAKNPRLREAKSKEDIVADARVTLLKYQEVSGVSDEVLMQKVNDFTQKNFTKTVVFNEAGTIEFGALKQGEIALMSNAITSQIQKILADQPI